MKHLKATTLALAVAISGQASAALMFGDDWGFNPDGTGLAGAITPLDEMTYNGISYTESAGTDSGDTFQDVSRLNATGFSNDGASVAVDGLNQTSGFEITAAFLDWSGTYGPTALGNTLFDFNAGGTLNVYIDNTPDYVVGGVASFANCQVPHGYKPSLQKSQGVFVAIA